MKVMAIDLGRRAHRDRGFGRDGLADGVYDGDPFVE